MVLNQRAVFFTISTIFFISILVFLFTAELQSSTIDTTTITPETTNAYREKFEQGYVPTIVKQAAYYSLYALATDAYTAGRYLILPNDITTALINGTYKGTGPDYIPLTGFQTLPQAFSNLSEATKIIGFTLTVAVNDVTVVQTGAWTGEYTMNITYNLSSQDNTTTFRRTIIVQDAFSLIGLPDLYYNRNAVVFGPAAGNRTLLPFNELTWNNTAFLAFANNKTYIAANQSPSYFNRLQGYNIPNMYGVETIIPTSITPSLNNVSIDSQYFNTSAYLCVYNHTGIYPNLRLSLEDILSFNITGSSLFYDGGGCPAAP